MHPNPLFRDAPKARIRAFVEARGFGVVTANGPDGPLAAHVPFATAAASEEDGDDWRLVFHLMRSNPLARALRAAQPALLVVNGPDAYVSPDWYDMGPDHVPTWNYVAAHLRGAARLLPEAALPDYLARLSEVFEARLAPKRPWTMDKLSAENYARLARSIQPAEFVVSALDGTWKLSQNRPPEARRNVAAAIDAQTSGAVGSEPAEAIAELMRALGETPAA